MMAANKGAFSASGTAATGTIGPILAHVDIAESQTCYLFRIALPGVKRNSADFSCDLTPTGQVIIKGVSTTGEATVQRFSQTFVMQTQNLRAPGPFTIYFQLPGPIVVDSCICTFACDAIFEGIVQKASPDTRSYKF